MNSAPALSTDGTTLYIAVSNAAGARATCWRSTARRSRPTARVALLDPNTGHAGAHHRRRHRVAHHRPRRRRVLRRARTDSGVAQQPRLAAAFQRHAVADETAGRVRLGQHAERSFRPRPCRRTRARRPICWPPSTTTTRGAGTGDGQNRMAVLDPSTRRPIRSPGIQVMAEVMTILGPTPDANYAGGVREWCVNTGAFDPATRSMLINNEDGYLYRWDLSTNQLVAAHPLQQRPRPVVHAHRRSAPTARSTPSTTRCCSR